MDTLIKTSFSTYANLARSSSTPCLRLVMNAILVPEIYCLNYWLNYFLNYRLNHCPNYRPNYHLYFLIWSLRLNISYPRRLAEVPNSALVVTPLIPSAPAFQRSRRGPQSHSRTANSVTRSEFQNSRPVPQHADGFADVVLGSVYSIKEKIEIF
jgi:predicted secreted protein